ncbi:hypothetical protein GCM10010532_112460 [Dactylosporangium siamense]|uniref:Uncharacterized protein n=1 Tax=Dactylosporangium siamense TaxID=685454 RepID=A0A919PZ95_9ACTN|nr:hypothetical protein Dsi01nite_111420 [Dactylosporangium siamense]
MPGRALSQVPEHRGVAAGAQRHDDAAKEIALGRDAAAVEPGEAISVIAQRLVGGGVRCRRLPAMRVDVGDAGEGLGGQVGEP